MRDNSARARGTALVLCVLPGFLILLCIPWHLAASQEEKAGGFQAYQQAFAEALKERGTAPAPAGPVWLQPEVLAEKEACTSCHLGLQDNRFLYARLPYRRHSGHYLDDHPPEQFGCTACHGGVADGLTFASAGHPPPDPASRRRQWEQHYGWRPPGTEGMVPLKRIAGRCVVCHPATDLPAGAEAYRKARALVAEKQCTACHRFRDEPVKHVRQAVHLDRLGSKVGGPWLEAFLKAPNAFRPATAMPAYRFGEGEIEALSTYLLSRDDPEIAREQDDPSGDAAAVERGLTVVRERRCTTCHDIPGIQDEGFLEQHKIGPSLTRVGEKLNSAWIRKWLADPHAIRPEAGMPRFRFKDAELEDVTAFLSSLRVEGPVPTTAASPATTDGQQATSVAAKYRCAACHSIAGLSLEPPPRTDLTHVGPEILARLAQAGTSLDSLEGPEGVFHRSPEAPRLFGPGEPAGAVLTFLAGEVDLPITTAFVRPAPEQPPAFEPTGPAGKLVEQWRCLSCHTIRGSGGEIGPDLTFAGSKLRRDWIVQFLQSPVPIRPMNRARMPKLGIAAEEAEILADWISSELTSATVEETPLDLESAFSFVGAAKVKSPYGCITCHRIGEQGGAVGPELTQVGTRLKTQWIYHWIQDPKRWVADVRMPVFEMNDADLQAITRYLSERK